MTHNHPALWAPHPCRSPGSVVVTHNPVAPKGSCHASWSKIPIFRDQASHSVYALSHIEVVRKQPISELFAEGWLEGAF